MAEGFPDPWDRENEAHKTRALHIDVIETVLKESPEKRVAKLIELGVLTDLEGYTWSNISIGEEAGRFVLFANINGFPVPMYKSLSHTDGKRRDINFFAFFGISETQKWLIKGDLREVNHFYGIKELEKAAIILTAVFNDSNIAEGKELTNPELLNPLLEKKYGIEFSNSTPLDDMRKILEKLKSSTSK